MRRLECERMLREKGCATQKAGKVAVEEAMGTGEVKDMMQQRQGGEKRSSGVVGNGLLLR